MDSYPFEKDDEHSRTESLNNDFSASDSISEDKSTDDGIVSTTSTCDVDTAGIDADNSDNCDECHDCLICNSDWMIFTFRTNPESIETRTTWTQCSIDECTKHFSSETMKCFAEVGTDCPDYNFDEEPDTNFAYVDSRDVQDDVNALCEYIIRQYLLRITRVHQYQQLLTTNASSTKAKNNSKTSETQTTAKKPSHNFSTFINEDLYVVMCPLVYVILLFVLSLCSEDC